MEPKRGVWEGDIWTELDVIADPVVRNVCRRLYRMILEMYNAEQLAKAVAKEVGKQERARFTKREKVVVACFTAFVSATSIVDTVVHLRMR